DLHHRRLPAVPVDRVAGPSPLAHRRDHRRAAPGRAVRREVSGRRRRVLVAAIVLMGSAVSINVLLVCGYSAFLLAVAFGFDAMARRAAMRAQRWRTGAFRYHPDHDAWTCPQDQWLWPSAYDPQQRIVRYRAKPAVCNTCPVKHDCTTSQHGREVVREIDPWPHSE